MNIELRRIRHKPDYVDGELHTDQGRLCSTLENSTYCLPVGKYRVTIAKCHQWARKKPIILGHWNEGSMDICNCCPKVTFCGNNTDMPCYCPQITPGNGACSRSDGAILVGDYGASGLLLHPKDVFDRIYEMLRKNFERGNEITLTII